MSCFIFAFGGMAEQNSFPWDWQKPLQHYLIREQKTAYQDIS